MIALIITYLLVALVTIYLFERCKWRKFIYAALWPASLIVLGVIAVFAAFMPSEDKFKLENM